MKYLILTSLLILSLLRANAQAKFQRLFGSNKSDWGQGLTITKDNHYLMAGGINTGPSSGYLVKTDSAGTIIWTKTYKTANNLAFNSLEPTNDSGFILHSFESYKITILKTDRNGDQQWGKQYPMMQSNLGAVKPLADGKYIILSANLLIKTDSLGEIAWAKFYPDTTTNSSNQFSSIALTNSGGYVLFGSAYNAPLERGYVVVNLDSAGNVKWSKIFSVPYSVYPTQIIATNDGGFLATGYKITGSGSPMHVLKTDSLGNLEWAKTFTGAVAFSVRQLSDNGYLFAGSAGDSITNAWLIKTDAWGVPQWSRTYLGTGLGSAALSVLEASDEGYLIAGVNGPYISLDAFLIKTDSLGSSGCNESTPSILDSNYYPQVTNSVLTVIPANVTTTNILITVGTGGQDSTLCSTLSIPETALPTPLVSIYPNPTSDIFTIKSSEAIKRIEITSTTGAVLYRSESPTNKAIVDLSQQARGVYFYSITFGHSATIRGKLLLQ